ncbi:MAG: hypothetical protein IIA40_07675 [SAR324 cluster bacterium]|nr:hypothetical protein [SAR324 cluster bacterium]
MKAQGFVAGFVAAASLLVLALPPAALAAQDGAMPLSTTDQAAVRVVIENQIKGLLFFSAYFPSAVVSRRRSWEPRQIKRPPKTG